MSLHRIENSIQANSIYESILEKWILWEKKIKVAHNSSLISGNYFTSKFIPSVQKKFGTKIIFDNMIATTILQKITSQFQYWKMLEEEDLLKYNNTHGSRDCISKISKCLFKGKFISKRKFNEIEGLLNQENKIQRGLRKIGGRLQKVRLGKKQKIILWDSQIQITLQEFWKILTDKYAFLAHNSLFQNLFQAYQECFCLTKIKKDELQYISNIFKPKNKLSVHLEDIADSFNFYKQVNLPQILMKLQQLQYLLTNKLKAQQGQKITINPYGSFKSRFCLVHSDIDLTILIQNQNGQVNLDRQYIKKKMWKLYNILKQEQQNYSIELLRPIINPSIKVPLISVKLCKEVYGFQDIDFVMNNTDGIWNSTLLSKFSQNQIILNLGILVKKWAKCRRLIDKSRFSSYGINLMVIYYLMETKRINFLTSHQLKTFNFSSNFIKKQELYVLFVDFFAFYSENSDFFKKRKMVCLVNTCTNHQTLWNQNFIINIHDPYDSSNPGRCKMLNKSLFNFSILQTIQCLQTVSQKQGNYQLLQQIFKQYDRLL